MSSSADSPLSGGGAHGRSGASESGSLVRAVQPSVPVREPYGPYGDYVPAVGPPQSDIWHAAIDLARMLYKRKLLIAAVALGFVVIGGARTLMQTPLYSSHVRLQIDRSAPRVMKDGDVFGNDLAAYDFDFMRTQIELLQSRSLAERVVATARLADDPDFLKSRNVTVFDLLRGLIGVKQARSSGEPDRSAAEWAGVGVVMGNRSVRPVSGSRLVDLVYTDPDPSRAQRIANAFGEEFIASALDKRFQSNAYAKTFLEDQVNQLRAKLEEQEKALLAFAEKEQIILVSERASIAENNLAAANAALGNLVTERIRNEQQWKQAETATGINLPQVLSSPSIETLRQRRYLLATEYQEKLETFKPGYPAMVQLQSKIREIDRQMAIEVEAIKKSLLVTYQSSFNQELEMKARIETLRAEVLDLQKRSQQHNSMKREVDSARQIYNGLLQRFKEVDVAGGIGTNNIFIVDRALAAGAPFSPNLSRALLFSLALGLGAGMLGAYALDRLDDTIRAPDQLEALAQMATLGLIPLVDVDRLEAEFNEPRSALAEAYRSLCTGLQFSTDKGLPKTLLISSAGPAEGKSSTAIAIARHFASLGLKVLLIDADLRNPSLHKKLGMVGDRGLSNYLTGACSPPEAFQRTSIPTLAFMASGPVPPSAADLLGSPKLGSLLNLGSEVFDFIVIDGPPVMGLADAAILSNAAVATAFVVGAGQARAGQVRAALKRLQLARSPVIGTILTKFDARRAGYGSGYGYTYGYGYGGAGYGQQSQVTAMVTRT